MSFGSVVRTAVFFLAAASPVECFLGGGGRSMATNSIVDDRRSLTKSFVRRTSLTSTSSPSSSSSTTNAGRASEGGNVLGVIFDIDGTLADSWNLGYQATRTVLAVYYGNEHTPQTYPLTPEEYHFGCRYTTPERLARHVGLDSEHPSFLLVGNELGRLFDEYYVQLVDKSTAGFYGGIGDLLVKLHRGEMSRLTGMGKGVDGGVKLGALTNACVEYAHAVLKANCPRECALDVSLSPSSSVDVDDASIYRRFSSIHGANSVPRPKPYGDGILQCCEEMGLPPSRVIYVGDAPTDARAAVDARCRAAIGVLWGSNDEECLKQEAGFTTLCRDVEELGRAIEEYL